MQTLTINLRPQLTKTLYLNIELGTPSKNCANFGICRIQMQSKPPLLDRKQCQCTTSGILKLLSKDSIQFLFPYQQLCKKCEAKHFSGRYFRIEEAYALPPEILVELGLTSFLLNPGWYQIMITEVGYAIQFSKVRPYYFG